MEIEGCSVSLQKGMREYGEVPASQKAPGKKSISEAFPRSRVAWWLSNPGAGGFR